MFHKFLSTVLFVAVLVNTFPATATPTTPTSSAAIPLKTVQDDPQASFISAMNSYYKPAFSKFVATQTLIDPSAVTAATPSMNREFLQYAIYFIQDHTSMVHDPTVTASLISEAKEIREDLEDRDSPRASTIQASENMFDDSKEIATGAVKGAANKAVSAGSRIGGGGANVSAAVLVAAGVLVVLALG